MATDGDPFERLERLLFRPISTRPDWLKAWRHEAQYLLVLARRASDDEDDELLQELEDLQLEGVISSTEQGLDYLKAHLPGLLAGKPQ